MLDHAQPVAAPPEPAGVRRRRSAAFVLGALRPTVLIPISHDLFGIALRQPLMGGTAFRTGSSLCPQERDLRSEEHTSELQSLMRISYAVFCLKKKTTYTTYTEQTHI